MEGTTPFQLCFLPRKHATVAAFITTFHGCIAHKSYSRTKVMNHQIILPLVPYRTHLRPAVLALLVAKTARRPGSHPESQSCVAWKCESLANDQKLDGYRRTPCTEHAPKQMLQNIVPHSSIFYGLIQSNISCQIPENRPKMSKIYQNTMYTMTMTTKSTVRLTDAANLVGSQ